MGAQGSQRHLVVGGQPEQVLALLGLVPVRFGHRFGAAGTDLDLRGDQFAGG